jgi:hypothetical protein
MNDFVRDSNGLSAAASRLSSLKIFLAGKVFLVLAVNQRLNGFGSHNAKTQTIFLERKRVSHNNCE